MKHSRDQPPEDHRAVEGARHIAVAAGTCFWLAGCAGSAGYASAIQRCVGERRVATSHAMNDLAFAMADVQNARVEVDAGGGQNRNGVGTEWTFAVPSRRRPEYVIVAVKNGLIPVPANRHQDVESFAIAVAHPERFDAVWLARGPDARDFLDRTDNCIGDEIVT